MLGKLTAVNPREVWQRESHDFTQWLHDNIGLLAEQLGMDLEVTGREVPVGSFAVGLVCQNLNGGDIVIIENQLEPTDHLASQSTAGRPKSVQEPEVGFTIPQQPPLSWKNTKRKQEL